MRITDLLTVPLAGILVVLPARAPAQAPVTVRFGAQLGPEIGVTGYAADQDGNWRTSYRHWTPVALYDVNGHYYRHPVPGARAVDVYSYHGGYFMPPEEKAWVGFDQRYNYRRRPNSRDYARERPYPATGRARAGLGREIGVLGYSSDRAGNWRADYQRWTPVTVYAVNGRYYTNDAVGARAVGVYRYEDEYFLPPQDHAWVGFDTRYDYRHRPTPADRAQVRIRP